MGGGGERTGWQLRVANLYLGGGPGPAGQSWAVGEQAGTEEAIFEKDPNLFLPFFPVVPSPFLSPFSFLSLSWGFLIL